MTTSTASRESKPRSEVKAAVLDSYTESTKDLTETDRRSPSEKSAEQHLWFIAQFSERGNVQRQTYLPSIDFLKGLHHVHHS